MKIVIASILLLAAAIAADKEFIVEMRTKMAAHVKSCAAEVSASESDVETIFNKQVPTTHEGKCVFFCMHKMFGAQGDDGALNMAAALESIEMIKDFDEDIYTKVRGTFQNCEGTPFVSDPCEFAAALVECLIKESKAIGLHETIFE